MESKDKKVQGPLIDESLKAEKPLRRILFEQKDGLWSVDFVNCEDNMVTPREFHKIQRMLVLGYRSHLMDGRRRRALADQDKKGNNQ